MARHRNVRKLDFHEGKAPRLGTSRLLWNAFSLCMGGAYSKTSAYPIVPCLSAERDFDDVYGRSYEDEVVVSPDTKGSRLACLELGPTGCVLSLSHLCLSPAQFLYQRDANSGPSLMTYMHPQPSLQRLTSDQSATASSSRQAGGGGGSGNNGQ